MVLLAFGEQNVLLHIVQNAFERVLRYRGEEIERRLGSRDVHSLRDTPVEHRARQTFFGYKRLGCFAIARLEKGDQLLRLPGSHLLECHVETRIGCGHRNDVLDTRFEGCGTDREISAAGGAEPIHGVELEIVKQRLRRLLPGMFEVDALTKRTTLA